MTLVQSLSTLNAHVIQEASIAGPTSRHADEELEVDLPAHERLDLDPRAMAGSGGAPSMGTLGAVAGTLQR